jgi:putative phage-type endonuclease
MVKGPASGVPYPVELGDPVIVQGSPEWFEQRLGHATCSMIETYRSKGVTRANEVKDVALERAYKKPIKKSFSNSATEHGHEHEDHARMLFEMGLPGSELVMQTSFLKHPTIEWFGGSPDGLLGSDQIIEIKCPWQPRIHIDYKLDRKIPGKYMNQVQGLLAVTGRQLCHFISYCPEVSPDDQLVVIEIERDEEFIEEMLADVQQFLLEVETYFQRLKGNQ